jgi:tRNA G37 N-methylase TrmD
MKVPEVLLSGHHKKIDELLPFHDIGKEETIRIIKYLRKNYLKKNFMSNHH